MPSSSSSARFSFSARHRPKRRPLSMIFSHSRPVLTNHLLKIIAAVAGSNRWGKRLLKATLIIDILLHVRRDIFKGIIKK